MGCKKLTYYESQSPLKVVYRKTEPQQKAVQWFLSVDPMASKFPPNSTYAFSENRVIDGVELEGLEVSRVNEEQNPGTPATQGVASSDITVVEVNDAAGNCVDQNVVDINNGNRRATLPAQVLVVNRNNAGAIQDPTPGDGIVNIGAANANLTPIQNRVRQVAPPIVNVPGQRQIRDNTLSVAAAGVPGIRAGAQNVVASATPNAAGTVENIFMAGQLSAGIVTGGVGGLTGPTAGWTAGQGANAGNRVVNVANGADNAVYNNITVDIQFNTAGLNAYTNVAVANLQGGLAGTFGSVVVNPVFSGVVPGSNRFFNFDLFLTR